MAMPLYVTAQIVKKAPKADKPAYIVKMIGDGKAQITCAYYVDKHPRPYEGMEDFFLLNPTVMILDAEPVTMQA